MAKSCRKTLPIDIDAWCGSTNVSSLSDRSYKAYTYLLMAQWQSSDGMISTDDPEIAKTARIRQSYWMEIKEEIMPFFKVEGERMFSPRCYADWLKCVGKRKPVKDDTDAKLMGTLPLNDGSDFNIREPYFNEMQTLYPSVNLKQEFRGMKAWLISNPTKRKTRPGIKSFINKWLSRAQNASGGFPHVIPNKPSKAAITESVSESILRRRQERRMDLAEDNGL